MRLRRGQRHKSPVFDTEQPRWEGYAILRRPAEYRFKVVDWTPVLRIRTGMPDVVRGFKTGEQQSTVASVGASGDEEK